jgi:nucleoside-diphosphate-sugar epimerase
MKKADISIMGCGWLGLPLAEQLAHSGKTVNGSTTSQQKIGLLEQKGITPFQIDLSDELLEEDVLQQFLQTDMLVLNIPPHLRSDGGESYLKQMKRLRKALLNSPVNRILFISSTSVYPDLNRTLTEEDIIFTNEATPANPLLLAEQLFSEREEWLTTILRFCGLVGKDREPGRFMAGKKGVPNGDAPVNLIHLEDCIAIILRLIEQEKWGSTYHACADEHPLRKDFYPAAAKALGLEPPEFLDMEETKFKIIKSKKLKEDLSYEFIHPDPMRFF